MAFNHPTFKLDVTKIQKEHLFHGAKGVYLDAICFQNRDGPGRLGDTHMIIQSVSKELRDQGVKGPIIGSATFPDSTQAPRTKPATKRNPGGEHEWGDDDSGTIPF